MTQEREKRVYLFKQPAFLDDVGNGLLLDAFCLVNVL